MLTSLAQSNCIPVGDMTLTALPQGAYWILVSFHQDYAEPVSCWRASTAPAASARTF
jgi:hypothetical protein